MIMLQRALLFLVAAILGLALFGSRIEAASKDEAIRLGEQFMQLHVDVLGQSYEGTLEVRPMFDPAGAGCS